jgi:hypothetical protein
MSPDARALTKALSVHPWLGAFVAADFVAVCLALGLLARGSFPPARPRRASLAVLEP